MGVASGSQPRDCEFQGSPVAFGRSGLLGLAAKAHRERVWRAGATLDAKHEFRSHPALAGVAAETPVGEGRVSVGPYAEPAVDGLVRRPDL